MVASLSVLTTDELNQGVVDIGTSRKEETAARTKLMEEEELLILGGGGGGGREHNILTQEGR